MICPNCKSEVRENQDKATVTRTDGCVTMHLACFECWLATTIGQSLERLIERDGSARKKPAPAAVKTRGEKYQDEPE